MIKIDDINPESDLWEMIVYVKTELNLKFSDFKGIDSSYYDLRNRKYDLIWFYYYKDPEKNYLWSVKFYRYEWDEHIKTGKDLINQ